MAQMDISLPDDLQAWAEAQVAEGRYSSIDDYISDLTRRDREYTEQHAALQSEIDKGFASPVDPRSKDEIFAELYSRLDAAGSRTAA